MIIKSLALALTAAVSTEVAVSAHEALSGANDPAIAAFGERVMPLDEKNELRKAAANPDELAAHLKAAVARNPYHSAAWIQLSVEAESSGNLTEARYDLDQASDHDATAEPRWAKANFYFRQGDQKQFLTWVNSYRSVTHNEEAGLFRMVAADTPDVHTMLVNMPNLGCDELGSLLDTVRERDLSPDELIDRMSSSCHDDASSKVLEHYMSDLLRTDKTDLAAEVRHRIGENDPLVNAYFSSPVTGEGFDWRINVNSNIQVRQESKQGIQFDFEDRVPSGTVLIFQPISLMPDSRYRLSTNLNSDPHEEDAFRWELVELSTGRHLASGLDEDNINKIPAWDFQIPKTGKTLALALFYKRAEGELPFQGTVSLQGVGLARELPTTTLTAGKR
jgi:hypothetical protein